MRNSATNTAPKLAALARKQIPTPAETINPPATAGPIARDALVSTLLRLTAFCTRSSPTSSVTND